MQAQVQVRTLQDNEARGRRPRSTLRNVEHCRPKQAVEQPSLNSLESELSMGASSDA